MKIPVFLRDQQLTFATKCGLKLSTRKWRSRKICWCDGMPRAAKLLRNFRFEGSIILICVRWYCRSSLSLRDVKELMAERGLSVDHTTIWRGTQASGQHERRVPTGVQPGTPAVFSFEFPRRITWSGFFHRSGESPRVTPRLVVPPIGNDRTARLGRSARQRIVRGE